jgi:hypothetical protein
MIVGNKHSFAVEYELDINYGGEWLYGKICYWIDNKRIGDYDLGTSLRDVLFQLKYIVYDSGNRDGGELCRMLPNELFYQLNELIYGNQDIVFQVTIDMPARFEIRIPVDIFDNWKIFLIDCKDISLILFKSIVDDNINVAYIENKEFDKVIDEVFKNLDHKYEKERVSA